MANETSDFKTPAGAQVLTEKQLREAATAFGLATYENGYDVLELSKSGKPKNGLQGYKGCMTKGWTSRAIERADVDAYGGRTRGIRMGRQHGGETVAAIDIDINDKATVDAVLDCLCEALGDNRYDALLIREGSGEKLCLLVRTDEEFHPPIRTPFFDRDGADARVEMFGSPSNQIGTFGVHSTAADDPLDIKIAYNWDGPSPAETPAADLPLVTVEELRRIATAVFDVMIAAGWEKRDTFGDAGDSGPVAYDLPPEVEARAAAMSDGERLRMLEIIGEGESDQRGIVRHRNGVVGVWDRNTSVMHLPERLAPAEIIDLVAVLDEKLRATLGNEAVDAEIEAVSTRVEKPTDDPFDIDVDALRDWRLDDWQDGFDAEADLTEEAQAWVGGSMDKLDWARDLFLARNRLNAMVNHIAKRFVFNAGDNDRPIFDLQTLKTRGENSVKKELASLSERIPHLTPQGAVSSTVVSAFDAWMKRSDRITAAGYHFDPTNTRPLIPSDYPGRAMVNNFRERIFRCHAPMDPEHCGALFRYVVGYQFPDERERDWWVNWFAHKVQHPNKRGQCVILLSDKGRTGRSTVLFPMMAGMFDKSHVFKISTGQILGDGAARWTAWQQGVLLALMDELLPTRLDKAALRAMNSALDELVDTMPMQKRMEQKNQDIFNDVVYWSGCFATNHLNAVALQPKDKRFTVLTNTNDPLAEQTELLEMLALVQKERGVFKEEFLAGLHAYLMSLETDERSFMEGIMTPAKREMIKSGQGLNEEALRDVLGDLAQDSVYLVWPDKLVRMVKAKVSHSEVKRDTESEVMKLLRVADGAASEEGTIDGWWFDPRKTVRAYPEGVKDGTVKGVVRFGDHWEALTPNERFEQLGPKPGGQKLRVVKPSKRGEAA